MTSSTNPFDSAALRRCGWMTRAASVAAIGVGLFVLVGWALDVSPFKSVFPGMATMKANTAISFVFAGLSLWLLRKAPTQPSAACGKCQRVAFAFAGVVFVLGLSTLSQDIFDFDLGIDELLFRDEPLNAHTAHPGRMAPATSLNFTLLGLALLGLEAKTNAGRRISQGLSLMVLVSGLLASLGYFYGVESLYRVQAYASMAVSTAMLFVLLGLGLFSARPERGLMSVLSSVHGGGLMSRRVLPLAILLPFLFGWLRLAGERAGWYGNDFGVALFATTNIILFTLLIWFSARLLNRVDEQRHVSIGQLRESEERLRLLVDAVTDYAIFMLDLQGRVVTWNAGAERLKGYRASEIIGQSFTRFYLPEDVQTKKAESELKVAAQDGRCTDEGWRVRKNGSRFWASMVLTAIRDARGELIGFAKVTRDLTERRQTEQALRESEERFRLMANSAPVLLWVSGLDKRCTFFNKTWLDFTGRTLEQEVGDGWAEGVHRDDLQRCLETYVASFDARQPFEMEYRLRRHDGEYRWLQDTGVPRFAPSGEFAGYVGSCVDITERKRAMEERLQLLNVLESSLNEIYIFDAATLRFDYVNCGAQRNLGYSLAELRRLTPLDLKPEHTEATFRELTGPLLRRERETQVFDTVHRRKDGSTYPVEVHLQVVDQGGRRLFLAVILDITARRRAEDALREANEGLESKVAERTAELEDARRQAETADRYKSEFLSTMSHEIRTPLNSVIGFSEFLSSAKPGPLNAKQSEYLGDILASGRHLLQLIDDVLDLAKVEAGRMEFHPTRFSVSQAVAEVCAVIQGIAHKKNVGITAEVSPAVTEVTLDEKKFKQVLFNLLSNAVKFTNPKGSVRIIVAPRDREGDGFFGLAVTDTGIGIRPEDLSKLFQEFKQLNPRTKLQQGGTGLGLALTRKIVEAQRGRISVESEFGTGSTFTVVLPTNDRRHVEGESETGSALDNFGRVRPGSLADVASAVSMPTTL